MQTKANLSGKQHREMLEMLKDLTPAERASLNDPNFITEDEADIIVAMRRMAEPSIPVEEVFAEFGFIPPSRRSS